MWCTPRSTTTMWRAAFCIRTRTPATPWPAQRRARCAERHAARGELMIGCFVTGTDTGVGKTLVSTGLLHALAPHHRRVVGMKPVAAGVVPWGEDWASEDAIALRSASTLAVAPELDNPVLLLDPLSPHIAAERAGVQIDIAAIVRSYQALAAQAD